MSDRFGLKETTIEKIQLVFSKHKEIEKVIIYGSRAMGNFKNGSDIDVTLCGGKELTFDLMLTVMRELDDLLLPYTFDVSIFTDIRDPDVRDHIQRVGIIFYTREIAEVEDDG